MYVDHRLDARIHVGQAKRVYGFEAMQVMETTPIWFMLDLALKLALRPPARHPFCSWPRTPRLSFQQHHSHLLIHLGGSPRHHHVFPPTIRTRPPLLPSYCPRRPYPRSTHSSLLR